MPSGDSWGRATPGAPTSKEDRYKGKTEDYEWFVREQSRGLLSGLIKTARIAQDGRKGMSKGPVTDTGAAVRWDDHTCHLGSRAATYLVPRQIPSKLAYLGSSI